MNDIEKKILKLCKPNLDEQEKKDILPYLNQKDFMARLEDFAEKHKIFPLIYIQLQKLSPQSTPEKIRKLYFLNVKRNILLNEESTKMQKILSENNISFIPLKGKNLIENVYKNIGSRYMVDIDILIKKKDLRKALMLMEKLGYKTHPKNPSEYHLLCSKNTLNQNYFIEIHWEIMSPRPYKVFLPDIWKKNDLTIEDNILISCLHIRRHIRNPELKDFCDILNMLTSKEAQIDYSLIKKISAENRAKSCVNFAIWAANLLFDCDFAMPFKINFLQKKIFQYAFPKDIFFNRDKFRPWLIRLFLFDSFFDVIVYFFKVALFEKGLKTLYENCYIGH